MKAQKWVNDFYICSKTRIKHLATPAHKAAENQEYQFWLLIRRELDNENFD